MSVYKVTHNVMLILSYFWELFFFKSTYDFVIVSKVNVMKLWQEILKKNISPNEQSESK